MKGFDLDLQALHASSENCLVRQAADALFQPTGLVYRAMGFPPQFFTVLFAIPRVTGYLSHWREQLSDPDVKIARPQQNYTVCPADKS